LRPTNDYGLTPPPLTLHSTLSPLSPNSPLYPDGIITPLWITKHQHRLPSVLVSFYNLIADQNSSSLEDNRLKAEVNNIRSLISSTNYKTKFVVVLVADGPINHTELEERLVNIRRGTNIESKALYYLPSESSHIELDNFAKVLFSTIQPTSIEYYRDLSKHARRKRSRNVVPQPTVPPTQATSSVLSLQGWNVRYEFKLGIFAETRQELDAASRNYEQAYEGLFHSELLGDAISAYSPRFDEARMLADVIAIRLIRCALWSSQVVVAVKWWTKHQDRIRELVDRRGKGTKNYGWEAWQTTWSKAMAELVERSEVFEAAASRLPPGTTPPVQIFPLNAAANIERQLPWEFLHHEGYWLNIARKHVDARRKHALSIADEDISKFDQLTKQTRRSAFPYDTYLAPEPALERRLLDRSGDNYVRRICTIIDDSLQAFQVRDQSRMIESLRFYQAREDHTIQKWAETMLPLKTLWDQCSWRSQGWMPLLLDVGEMMLKVAVETEDYELCLRLVWELATLKQRPDDSSSLRQATEPLSTTLDLNTAITPLAMSFAFASASGHVGEPIAVQLSLSSFKQVLPMGLEVVEVKVAFDGGINAILLTGVTNEELTGQSGETVITHVELQDAGAVPGKQSKRLSMADSSYSTGTVGFTSSAGMTNVLNFEIVPREAGPVSVASIIVLLRNESRELTLNAGELTGSDAVWWESRNGRPVCRPFGKHRDVTAMTVLPKPPKLDIKLPNFKSTYYTNEKLALQVEIFNGEEAEINGHIEARLISPVNGMLDLRWKHNDAMATVKDGAIKEAALPPAAVEGLAVGTSNTYTILVSGLTDSVDHELEIKVAYALSSDPASALIKQTMADLRVIRPLEVSTLFMPRIHEEAWPDFFAPPATSVDRPCGLKQKFLVRADVGCFAQEELEIHSLDLEARRIVGGAICTTSTGRMASPSSDSQNIPPKDDVRILPEKTEQFVFDMELQKLVLGDRSPVATDFAINIMWSRSASEERNTSTLVLPRFLTPMSEPRVLVRASKTDAPSGMYLLTYTIENPSMHFLTFSITMEGGESLAFSGPKSRSVSLVPMSRYDIRYHIYTPKSKAWARIQLEVLDAFFGQRLKVQPASEGVRLDKQGGVEVWCEG